MTMTVRLHGWRNLVTWAIMLGGAVLPLNAQVRGRVVDSTGRGIGAAQVVVAGRVLREADEQGAFVLLQNRGSGARIDLGVRRLGYRPWAGSVPRDTFLTIVLYAEPPVLAGVAVIEPASDPLTHTVTTASARHVPPLLEPDVFRAIALLPEASQPDDLKGRVHLHLAASDETGVTLSGHPLQEPFHLLGVLGAFNLAALEQATVRAGSVGPEYDGDLGGVISLTAKRPGARDETELVASLLSSSATYSTRRSGFGLLASGRLTYLGLVLRRLASESRGGGDTPMPDFRDALLVIDRGLGSRWSATITGFHTGDRLASGTSLVQNPTPLNWGERMLGLSLDGTAFGWNVGVRASSSRWGIRLETSGNEESIDTRRTSQTTAMTIDRPFGPVTLSSGLNLTARHVLNSWNAVGSQQSIFSQHTPAAFFGDQRQSLVGFHLSSRTRIGRVIAQIGARASTLNGQLFPAPRLALQVPAGPGTLMVTFERRFQFDAQLEEPVAGSVSAPVFLLDVPRRADVVATGWRSGGPHASLEVQAFVRRYADKTDLVVTPGDPRVETQFPYFRRVPGRSAGGSVAVRRTWEVQTSAALSYAYQRAYVTYDGLTTPTSLDAPHTLTGSLSTMLAKGWTVDAVLTARSGSAITPVGVRLLLPVTDFSGQLTPRYLDGERNSARLPSYRRIDLAANRTWNARGANWTLSLQVLNLLAAENRLSRDWFSYFCAEAGKCRSPGGRGGLPLVPSAGLAIRW